jgi:hypothetical protein
MRPFIIGLFAACCMAGLSTCYTPREGCLDIAASNFDATADENCCCVYPNLRLQVEQVFDTLNFIENRIYQTGNTYFRIKNVVFYLSDFELVQNSLVYRVSDTVVLSVFNAPGDTVKTTFLDDFLLLRRENIDNAIGVFPPTGTFEKIRFRIGLNTSANTTLPSRAPTGHPLAPQNDTLWRGNIDKFVFAKMIVSGDTSASAIPDTLRFTAADLPNIIFEQNTTLEHEPGYDFIVGLKIDYKVLFQNVDWSAPASAIKLTIRDNLAAALIVF